jgi:DNA-binding LacI/PurR family transcriptional regulator
MLEALSRGLQRIGRIAMLINTAGDRASVDAALRQTLNYRAKATIVLSGTPPAALVTTCINSGQQVILINRDDQLDGPRNIIVDNGHAGRESFHMLKRAGCSKIAVVSSTAGTPSLTAREQAFEAAAKAADIGVRIVQPGPTSYASGFAAGQMLLSGSDRPDGVFCVTDLLACGFMDAARFEFGIDVPGQLCVIGFDDIDQAGWSSYALTTFRQPVEDMAGHIMDLIEHPDADSSADERACFHALPVWRRSVRPK